MTTVRAKFRCAAKSVRTLQNEKVFDVLLDPVTGGSPENERFYAMTPAGSLNLYLVREAVAELFTVGEEFYMELTPASEMVRAQADATAQKQPAEGTLGPLGAGLAGTPFPVAQK